MNSVHFDMPWSLLLLPLALLPLVRGLRDASASAPWLALVPRDLASTLLDAVLRIAAALAIAATVCVLAGPYREGQVVSRVGQGAEMVLVIDRSSSMDEGFRGQGAQGLLRNIRPAPGEETKASIARDVISRLGAAREHDSIALVLFSERPMAFLPFTQKNAVVQAAIDASRIGRGLGNTDIGAAMLAAVTQFETRPYAGSRVIVLVSDGGAHLDEDTRAVLGAALRRNRVGVYWIYLRGAFGQKLELTRQATAEEIRQLPEQSLHDYFSKAGVPYRAYEAVEVASVQAAIDDLARQEQHPLHYLERQPRLDLATPALWVALGALGVWLGSRVLLLRGAGLAP